MQARSKSQEILELFYTFAAKEPEALQGVYEKVVDTCRESLVLQFTNQSLFVTADPDDDTIRVHYEDNPSLDAGVWTRLDSGEPWHALLGSTFGWGWVAINQQGYCDGVLLSFDGIVPTLLLSVIASSITVSRIQDVTKEAEHLRA
jgi:hypothetical protein